MSTTGRNRGWRFALLFTLRLFRLAGVVFLVLLLLSIGIATLLFTQQSEFLARFVSGTLSRELLTAGHTLRLRNVSGNPLGTLILEDISLTRAGGDTLFAADEIRTRYPVGKGLKRQLYLEELTIIRPRVTLVELPEGGLHLPWEPPAKTSRRSTSSAVQRIDALTLVGASLELRKREGDAVTIFRDLFLNGDLVARDGALHILVSDAHGDAPIAKTRVDSLRTAASIRDDRLFLGDIRLRTGDTRVLGVGVVSLKAPTDLSFDLEVPEAHTADVWRVVELEDVAGTGTLSGFVSLSGTPDTLDIAWDVKGVLNEDPIDRLRGSGTLTDTSFRLADLSLRSGGSEVRGDAWFQLDAPRAYRGSAHVTNMDLSDVPIHDELVPLHAHRANGLIDLVGDDFERPFPKMDVMAAMGPSQYLGVPIDSLVADIRLSPEGGVEVRQATARIGGGRIRGAGRIVPDDSCAVDVSAVNVPIHAFESLHAQTDLVGVFDFEGRVTGSVDAPDVAGSGVVRSLGVGDVTVETAHVDSIRGVLVPFRARARVDLAGVRVGSVAADSAWARVSVSDTVRVESLVATRGDSALTAAGWVRARDGVATGGVSRAALESPTVDVTLAHPFPFRHERPGTWNAGPMELRMLGGAVRLRLEGDRPRTRTVVSAEASDVDLLTLLDPIPGTVVTSAPIDLEAMLVLDPVAPALSGTMDVPDLRIGDIHVSRVTATVAGGADSLRIVNGLLDLPIGRVEVEGALRGGTSPVAALFADARLDSLLRADRMLDLDVRARDVDLATVGRIHGIASPAKSDSVADILFVRDRGQDLWQSLAGVASAEVHVRGSLRNPDVRVTAATDSVRIREQVLDRVELHAVHRDSLLTISQFDIVTEGELAQISGFVPSYLDVGARRIVLLERNMEVALDLSDAPFSLISIPFPDLVVTDGRVSGTGRLAGTPGEPEREGAFTLVGGKLRWSGRRERLHDVTAKVVLVNDGILVNEFSGTGEGRGTVRGSGIYRGEGSYRFDVGLQDFRVSEDGMLAKLDGNLNISPDRQTAGRLLPRVEGLLSLPQGQVLEWPREKPEQSPDAITALYDLRVDVGRIRVNTNELYTSTNASIGDGTLTVRNYPETLRLGGQLSVLDGGGSVYRNQFRVTRGELNFYAVDGVNPELDIVAESTIRGPYARERGFENAKIIATVTGTLREPVITLTTDPEDLGLSQTEILEYLTYGRYVAGDNASPNALAPTADVVLSLVTQDLANLFPYVDYLEVNTSEDEPSIHIVKSISDDWTIGYTTGVSSSPDQELSVEARLSRIFFLKGGVVREELGGTNEVGGRYNLDLRLNFEY